MSSSNAIRFLSDAAGTDDLSLGLKLFWGSVVEAFRNKTLLYDNNPAVIAKKRVTSGKSHQFIMLSDTPDPEDHTPGDELLGQQYEMDEGVVTVDNLIAAHHDVPIDQLMVAHFDVIGPLAARMGKKLARTYDQRLFRLAVLAARTASASKNGLNIHNGGNRVERVGASGVTSAYAVNSTGAEAFRDDVAQLAQLLDEDNVPEEGRYLFTIPYMRRVCQAGDRIFDSDINRNVGNSMNNRVIGEIAGIKIVPTTNHMPSTNVTTGPTKYQGDFRYNGSTGQPVAVCLCGAEEGSAAIGLVELMGIIPKMQEDVRRSTMFMKAEMFVGANIMHPWCAGVIEVDDS